MRYEKFNVASRVTIADAKSYATEENLCKALIRLDLDGFNPLIVRNGEGRWTAVFSIALSGIQGGYLGFASQYGFLTVN